MTSWYFAFLMIIVVWALGVIGFSIWIFRKVIPDVKSLFLESDLTEEEKQILMIKAMFPPKFNR